MQTHEDKRYEVKLVAHGLSLNLARSWIRTHGRAFVPSYPPRRVNNLYFDTHGLQWLEDSLEGISERRKVRFRWYGDATSAVQGVFEVKRKLDQVSWKVRYPLTGKYDLEKGPRWASTIPEMMAELPPWMKSEVGADWTPILINRYRREYYVSGERGVRITLDSGQEVYDQRLSAHPNLSRRALSQDTVIIEVKGGIEVWERVKDVVSELPVSITRNSKYTLGFEAIASL
jgi:hypothetical protein